jgi:hypothetical protein
MLSKLSPQNDKSQNNAVLLPQAIFFKPPAGSRSEVSDPLLTRLSYTRHLLGREHNTIWERLNQPVLAPGNLLQTAIIETIEHPGNHSPSTGSGAPRPAPSLSSAAFAALSLCSASARALLASMRARCSAVRPPDAGAGAAVGSCKGRKKSKINVEIGRKQRNK